MGRVIRKILNGIRTLLIFGFRYPWIRRGQNTHCQWLTTWSPPRHVILGNNVGIGHRCVFLCDEEIGNQVLIASSVAFLNSDDHMFNVVGKCMWDSGRGDQYKIVVEDDVWIGYGAIISTPAHVGRGSSLLLDSYYS